MAAKMFAAAMLTETPQIPGLKPLKHLYNPRPLDSLMQVLFLDPNEAAFIEISSEAMQGLGSRVSHYCVVHNHAPLAQR